MLLEEYLMCIVQSLGAPTWPSVAAQEGLEYQK